MAYPDDTVHGTGFDQEDEDLLDPQSAAASLEHRHAAHALFVFPSISNIRQCRRLSERLEGVTHQTLYPTRPVATALVARDRADAARPKKFDW